MKHAAMAVVILAVGSLATPAEARPRRIFDHRHCERCVKVFETTRLEERMVLREIRVQVGERDEIVGWRDAWVDRAVATTETRTVVRHILVGYDGCGRPVYQSRQVRVEIPVTRVVRVLDRQPVVERRPVFETRTVESCETVEVPVVFWYCR